VETGRPCTRPVYTGVRFPLPEFHGPSWRVSKNAPEFTGRQLGPWTRAVNSGSGNRPLGKLCYRCRNDLLCFCVSSGTLNSTHPLVIVLRFKHCWNFCCDLQGVRLAKKFEALVLSDRRFEVPARRHLGMVVFRLKVQLVVSISASVTCTSVLSSLHYTHFMHFRWRGAVYGYSKSKHLGIGLLLLRDNNV